MGRGPGQRAGLTHAAVVAAAWTVIADRGLDGLSMRAVASRLGVAPNALYSHVANRTALVDALLDDLLADVPAPAGDTPHEALRTTMLGTFDVVAARADLVPVYLARHGARGANARALGAAMITELAEGGVTGTAADDAVRVLIVHTLGFAALAAAGGPVPVAELRDNLGTGLDWLLTGILTRSDRQ